MRLNQIKWDFVKDLNFLKNYFSGLLNVQLIDEVSIAPPALEISQNGLEKAGTTAVLLLLRLQVSLAPACSKCGSFPVSGSVCADS